MTEVGKGQNTDEVLFEALDWANQLMGRRLRIQIGGQEKRNASFGCCAFAPKRSTEKTPGTDSCGVKTDDDVSFSGEFHQSDSGRRRLCGG